ncbi:hypothetical protein AVEN_75410-1 [Araneus ventricosus]|uniref:Uncharacterized protein n=1 Tax=Araneus ventricosus TaxID=182803 RepID=A0A4Y2J7N5_ARAVE|nr:hypothetical protein AVEN_75410-1 [Araneus ventricosus]
MLEGMRPTDNILISLPIKEMSVEKDTQKVEEESLTSKDKRLGGIKGVITKKLKFDSFKKSKLLPLMTPAPISKENIIQCPECYKIYVDPPSEG